MKYDIIMAGVGGQGILSLAFVIDNACVKKGLHFKQAEVHGMSQRGGAVQSHLRVSEQPILSDLIPSGRADMILAVEPLEVNRYLSFLGPDGVIVSNSVPVENIPNYPVVDEVHRHLLGLPNVTLMDGRRLAKAAGNQRAQNMVMLGAASCHIPFFSEDDLLPFVKVLFDAKGERIVDLNLRAFAFGRNMGLFIDGLVKKGVERTTIFRLSSLLDPATVTYERAAPWAKALLAAGPAVEERLAPREESVPADDDGLKTLLG